MAKLKLLAEFVRNPSQIGTVFPSSVHLAKAMTSGIGLEKANSVVEVGPGTAPFTPFVIEKIKPSTKYFAVEINETMVTIFRKKNPHLKIYNRNAVDLKKIIREENIPAIDVIVSGIPWAIFPLKQQYRLLKILNNCLSEGGYFATYAYLQGKILPAGARFKIMLDKLFSEVKISEIVWKNVPPAIVYRCKK